eukprot:1159312-Pelagomonas_calceolata.AAC.2
MYYCYTPKVALTSKGSVASNAEKIAKPVSPDTQVVLVQCLGQQRDLPAADHALLSLKQSAADLTPEAPSSAQQGRACSLLYISSATFRAFTSPFMQQLTPSFEHELKIPLKLQYS